MNGMGRITGMNRTHRKFLLVFLIIICLGVYFNLIAQVVFAVPIAPTQLTPGVSSHRTLTSSSNVSTDVSGGNLTELDIATLTITKSWAGFYGDVSGEITLDDANNNTFYNWSLTTFSGAGEVYATRAVSPDWDNTQCVSAAVLSAEEAFLDNAGKDDSVTNTYFKSTHPAFDVSGSAITGCNSTNAFVSGAMDGNRFWQVLLDDASGNIIYSTIVDSGQTAYNGETHDFQLLVGENNNLTSSGTTAYYIWIEIS